MSPPSWIETLPTRNPSEVSFRVPADAKMLNVSNIPADGTAFKDTNIPGVARMTDDGFGDYVYCYMSKEGPTMWFYFCKNKTPTERNTPFRTFQTSRLWRWPTVLNALIFIPDSNFPTATPFPVNPTPTTTGGSGLVFAPSMIQRMNITPEALALSLCVVEQFTSDVPWDANELTHLQPTEGTVSWDYPGTQGSITCLHDDIRLPSRGKAYTTVISGTTSADAAPFVPERIFPATNFPAWAPFVISDDVVEENGVWFRERVTIYPPEENEPSQI